VIAVFGGYGVFGSLVCRELARRGAMLTVIGRSAVRAEAFAAQLGPGHRGRAADVHDPVSAREALAGHSVAVHCAGPFASRPPALLDACLDTGCHYVDIADDRAYVAHVRGQHGRAVERGVTAAYGCSSLPGLSIALAIVARGDGPAPERVRITLFIGNDNAKSEAAIRSVVFGLGRDIRAPQGRLRGFRERERVALPPPFGGRTAYAFESPDYDLLPDAVGARAVTVLVGFENALAGPVFAGLARLGPRWGARTAALLAPVGGLDRRGHSGGVVMAELLDGDGSMRRAALHAARDGQRLAAVPAALVAHALETGAATRRGAFTAYEMLGAETLVSQTQAAGFERWPA
jgi:hypothetical protein